VSSSEIISGPPILLQNAYRGLFLRGVKRCRLEADHPPSSADVRYIYIYLFIYYQLQLGLCPVTVLHKQLTIRKQ
jgi:hypothetical protein